MSNAYRRSRSAPGGYDDTHRNPRLAGRYRIVQSSQAWYVTAVDERRVVSLTGPALGAELSRIRIGATLA